MCVACNPGVTSLLRHTTSRRAVLGGALAFSASAWLPKATAQSSFAEVIFRNGTVITMDRTRPRAEAVAVSGGKILAVGSESALDGLTNSETRVVDLGGGTLLPGLIDPHMHHVFVAFESWLNVGPFAMASVDEAIETLRKAAAKAAPGEWVKGWQFDASIMPGTTRIDLALLDRIAPDNPLIIYESNGHIAHVNSKALEVAGITRETPDPPQGKYQRDHNGELTGRLDETPAILPVFEKIGMPTGEEIEAAIERLFVKAASRGCTGLYDCGIGVTSPHELALLEKVMAKDQPVRFGGTLVSTHMKEWRDAGLEPGAGNDRFRLSGIKAWSDGSNQGRSGYLREPYLNSDSHGTLNSGLERNERFRLSGIRAGSDGSNQGRSGYQREPHLNSDNRGTLNYTLEQLTEAVRAAHDDGWNVSVHANGDAAIDTTIDAYETVLKDKPRSDHRHRIEHCSILHDDQIARMKALGLSPSFLIGHVYYWGRAFRDDILGPERANRLDRCASVLKAGMRPTLHSDWNVTEIEPLRMIENAVTRIMRDGGEVLNPDERVSPEDALRMVTADAAWQCSRDFTGVLAAGKAADLVILDADPTEVEPTTIRNIAVRETWLDGKRRFQA